MNKGDRVQRGISTGEVVDLRPGEAFVRFASGTTGWIAEGDLTVLAAKTWPPETETK